MVRCGLTKKRLFTGVVFGLADPAQSRGAVRSPPRCLICRPAPPWDEGKPGVERSRWAARNDNSGGVAVICRPATAHSGPPERPAIPETAGVVLPGQAMIRHPSNPGAVTAVAFGVHRAATGIAW
jgi:hypothetical protein